MDKWGSVMKKLEKNKQAYLNGYFENAPDSVKKSMMVTRIPREKVFISEGEQIYKIYIMLTGRVLAVDYRIEGIAYKYLKFEPIEIFGAMELALGEDKYRTSLLTVRDSLFLEIPRKEYEAWMKNDLKMFSMQTEKIIRHMLEEARKERIYVLLSATERVWVFLCRLYQRYERGGIYVVTMSRRRFADSVGISERTYTRIITDMQKRELVKKEGRNIVVTQKQYEKMRKMIEDKVHGMI